METSLVTKPRVLFVDDEPGLTRGLGRLLALRGNEVTTASNGRQALALIDEMTFDVVLSDIRMPGMDGLSLLRSIRAKDLDLPVVFLTGSPSLETAVEAMEYGAFRYLTKPVDGEQLVTVVARAARTRQLALVRREMLAEGQGSSIGDRAGLEARFESALDKLWIAMQPILSWRRRTVFAYEALLRTDEGTLRNPVEFVGAAERLNRTHELGRRIRRQIADQLSQLPSSVNVFVNLHPADLLDEELSSPQGALAPHAHRIVLEVTERAALEQFRGIVPAILRLRELDYRIAIDDLGAGYAGLSSFALLEPEVVKVDMSLVRDIHRSETKQKLFRSVASLCKDLDTQLVAEGVEVPAERDCLDELGADFLQGYLFARPNRGFPAPVY